MPKSSAALKKELSSLLSASGAHKDIEAVLHKFPIKDAGKKPHGLPYSAWQILEHLRIAQADILEYVTNPKYKERRWPEDYWPKSAWPPTSSAWSKSLKSFLSDRKKFLALLKKTDPLKPIAFANKVTLLREIHIAADHTAYHLGELVVLRRLIGNWKE